MRRIVIVTITAIAFLVCAGPATYATPNGDWRMWQYDATGSRYNPNEKALTPATVGSLKLKWAFAFPGVIAASSQPAVVDGTVYVGGRDGKLYALDARTGAQRWAFDVKAHIPNHPTYWLRDGPAVANGKVYFGDNWTNVWALNAKTGALQWVRKVDNHPNALITSSPLAFEGRVYIGVSSNELGSGVFPDYPCCTFRGSVVALDGATGEIKWKHYTIPESKPTGRHPAFAPSGAAVWSSPTIDPGTRTLYYASGNAYSGNPDGAEAVGALDIDTGKVRWIQRPTPDNAWNVGCVLPVPGGNCPEHPGRDFDIGSQPNVFELGDRPVVGVGQKNGVYHLFDARTGKVIWHSVLSVPHSAVPVLGHESLSGIQWGAGYDGRRLYVATYGADPGALHALDPVDGHVIWKTPNPADGCLINVPAAPMSPHCQLAMPSAVSATPGLVYEGSLDGKMRVFSADTGAVLWTYNTARPFVTVNGVAGFGGGISGHGAVIANGMLYTNSGYAHPITTGMPGNVLLAFGLP